MKYLYYHLYRNFKKVKTNDTPAINAMFLISAVEGINILTILLVINHFFHFKNRLYSKNEAEIFAIILGLALFVINYFVLLKNKKEIFDKYKNESKIKSRIGFSILLFYLFGSFALVYIINSIFPI